MKNVLRIVLCVMAVIVVVGAVASCGVGKDKEVVGGDTLSQYKIIFETDDGSEKTSGMVSEGRLYFHHSKTEALLVDSKGSLLWLYSENKGVFENFDTGDYIRVDHGMIMETYPGQTYISKIALIEDGDINSFTDEEWGRLNEVFVEPIER